MSTTNATGAPGNLPTVETEIPAQEAPPADSQNAVEAGAEKPAETEKAAPKNPERSDEFVDHFNRLVADGASERAAAKSVLGIARELASRQADRAMHVTENTTETINGALERIRATLLDESASPLVSLQQIVEQIRFLKNEHADNLERVEGQVGGEDSGSEEPVA